MEDYRDAQHMGWYIFFVLVIGIFLAAIMVIGDRSHERVILENRLIKANNTIYEQEMELMRWRALEGGEISAHEMEWEHRDDQYIVQILYYFRSRAEADDFLGTIAPVVDPQE